MRNLYFSLFLALLSLLTASGIEAQVWVQTSLITFRQNQTPVTNVAIKNTSNKPLSVETSTFFLEHPGTAEEWEATSDDIVISPKTFVLPPNGQRLVRILLRKSQSDVERAYHAYFRPTDKPLDEATEKEAAENKVGNEKSAGLSVSTAMGILIFTEPREVREELVWERKGKSLVFTNKGNVNFFVSDMLSCNRSAAESDDTCIKVPPVGKRIYPGNTFTWEGIDEKNFIKFSKRQGTQNMKSVRLD